MTSKNPHESLNRPIKGPSSYWVCTCTLSARLSPELILQITSLGRNSRSHPDLALRSSPRPLLVSIHRNGVPNRSHGLTYPQCIRSYAMSPVLLQYDTSSICSFSAFFTLTYTNTRSPVYMPSRICSSSMRYDLPLLQNMSLLSRCRKPGS